MLRRRHGIDKTGNFRIRPDLPVIHGKDLTRHLGVNRSLFFANGVQHANDLFVALLVVRAEEGAQLKAPDKDALPVGRQREEKCRAASWGSPSFHSIQCPHIASA